MFVSTIIGNLGSNAEFKTKDGREFVTFSLGVNDRWKDNEGKDHEETQWISCVLNGRNDNLLPYLIKGATVCVMGRTKAKLYSSPKDKCMKAGVNLDVIRLELVGKRPDEIPSMLYDTHGIGHVVYKAYYIAAAEIPAVGDGLLVTPQQERFCIDANGFISKFIDPATQQTPQQAAQADNPEVY